MGLTKSHSIFFSVALIIFVGLLYGLTAMEFVVTFGKTINWLNIFIGIVGALFGIYIWFYVALIIFVGLLYELTAMEFVVMLGKTINWLSIFIGIVGALFGIYIWFYNRANARKATLYFPLFLACRGIIEIIKNHETLGYDRSRNLLASCASTLDEIIYKHGSIIYLKKLDDLSIFLSLKEAIDVNIVFAEKKSWYDLKKKFKSDEFKEVERYANTLLSRCKEEVKEIKELP